MVRFKWSYLAHSIYIVLRSSLVPFSPRPSSRALDDGSADDCEDVVRDFLQQETGHLIPPQLSYFSHWLLLCCLEAASMEAKNGRKRVWLQTAEERYTFSVAQI